MGLRTKCDRCGTSVLGVSDSLQRVDGEYLCIACRHDVRQAGATRRLAYFCPRCNTTSSHAVLKGQGWVEAVLYLFYLVPGIIYSVWRRSSPPDACPACRTPGLVRVDHAASGVTRDEVECPHCAEPILARAQVCKHCGRDVALTLAR